MYKTYTYASDNNAWLFGYYKNINNINRIFVLNADVFNVKQNPVAHTWFCKKLFSLEH